DDGILGDWTFMDDRAKTLFDRRNKVLRNAAADDLLIELECRIQLLSLLIGGFSDRLEPADDMGELAAAAGLLLVLEVELGLLGRRFAVADLRGADFQLDFVFAAYALDVNIEVQLAHAGDDRLTR